MRRRKRALKNLGIRPEENETSDSQKNSSPEQNEISYGKMETSSVISGMRFNAEQMEHARIHCPQYYQAMMIGASRPDTKLRMAKDSDSSADENNSNKDHAGVVIREFDREAKKAEHLHHSSIEGSIDKELPTGVDQDSVIRRLSLRSKKAKQSYASFGTVGSRIKRTAEAIPKIPEEESEGIVVRKASPEIEEEEFSYSPAQSRVFPEEVLQEIGIKPKSWRTSSRSTNSNFGLSTPNKQTTPRGKPAQTSTMSKNSSSSSTMPKATPTHPRTTSTNSTTAFATPGATMSPSRASAGEATLTSDTTSLGYTPTRALAMPAGISSGPSTPMATPTRFQAEFRGFRSGDATPSRIPKPPGSTRSGDGSTTPSDTPTRHRFIFYPHSKALSRRDPASPVHQLTGADIHPALRPDFSIQNQGDSSPRITFTPEPSDVRNIQKEISNRVRDKIAALERSTVVTEGDDGLTSKVQSTSSSDKGEHRSLSTVYIFISISILQTSVCSLTCVC